MTLSDIAAIGSVLSSFAVCGSLIYLALQVRQTDRNQRTLLQHGVSTRNMEYVFKVAEPHVAEVFAKALRGETDFTDTQTIVLNSAARSSLLGFQDQYLLRKHGLMGALQLETQERISKYLLSTPATRALWDLTRERYAPEFAGYVDALLKDVPVMESDDLTARLNVAAAELKVSKNTFKPT